MGSASNPSSNAVVRLSSSLSDGFVFNSAYRLLTSFRLLLNIPRKRTSGKVRNDRSTLPEVEEFVMWGRPVSESATMFSVLLNDHPMLQLRSRRAPSHREREVLKARRFVWRKVLISTPPDARSEEHTSEL